MTDVFNRPGRVLVAYYSATGHVHAEEVLAVVRG